MQTTVAFDELLTPWLEDQVRLAGGDPDRVSHVVVNAQGFGWVKYLPSETPRQGWKLHLSATTGNAIETFSRVVPELVQRAVSFKMVSKLQDLSELNAGHGGASQIGKAMTVYPESSEQAVEVAACLDNLVTGLAGPRIPSDFQYRPGSAVHYRFGGIDPELAQLASGEVITALRGPDGVLEPDRRETKPYLPPWVDNPFPTFSDEDVSEPLMLRGRYLLTGYIALSFISQVLMAVDIKTARPCLVKRSDRPFDAARQEGKAFEIEARVLEALAHLDGVPRVIDRFSDDRFDYLVISDLGRHTLERIAFERRSNSGTPELEWLVDRISEVAAILADMHDAGYVHGDAKPSNMIVGPDGTMSLIDFGTAAGLRWAKDGLKGHTPGFVTAQRAADGPVRPEDDVHGLGATLLFLACGINVSAAEGRHPLCGRRPSLLVPGFPDSLERLIARAVGESKEPPFADARAFQRDLAAIQPVTMELVPWGSAPRDGAADGAWPLESARRVLTAICDRAIVDDIRQRGTWSGLHPAVSDAPVRDLNWGTGGVVLGMAELHMACGDAASERILRAAAWDVLEAPPFEGGPLPGLLMGEAGIGLAAVRAGQSLGEDRLITAGIDRVRSTMTIAHPSPDFFNGRAGRILAHVILHELTGEPSDLDDAIRLGNEILDAGTWADSGLFWAMPAGMSQLTGTRNLGYAHGAAGIADMLLLLHQRTGDRRFKDGVHAAFDWIAGQAVSGVEGRVDWPGSPGEQLFGPVWCHGAAGIGQFLVRAIEAGIDDRAAELLAGAVRATARGARHLCPIQCHGLAGNIELLLDAYQTSGAADLLQEAMSLADLLAGLEERESDQSIYVSDSPGSYTPAYWIGYAGVGVSLLRVADPSNRPRQLSVEGFSRDWSMTSGSGSLSYGSANEALA